MNDWKERQMIQRALLPLRASPETLEEVLHMKETKRTGATGRRMAACGRTGTGPVINGV